MYHQVLPHTGTQYQVTLEINLRFYSRAIALQGRVSQIGSSSSSIVAVAVAMGARLRDRPAQAPETTAILSLVYREDVLQNHLPFLTACFHPSHAVSESENM